MERFQLAVGAGNGVVVAVLFGLGQCLLGPAQGLVAIQDIADGGLFQGRDFLGHHGQAPVRRAVEGAAVALQFAHDKLEQRTFAGTVTAHQTHAPALVKHKAGVFQQQVGAAAQIDVFQ